MSAHRRYEDGTIGEVFIEARRRGFAASELLRIDVSRGSSTEFRWRPGGQSNHAFERRAASRAREIAPARASSGLRFACSASSTEPERPRAHVTEDLQGGGLEAARDDVPGTRARRPNGNAAPDPQPRAARTRAPHRRGARSRQRRRELPGRVFGKFRGAPVRHAGTSRSQRPLLALSLNEATRGVSTLSSELPRFNARAGSHLARCVSPKDEPPNLREGHPRPAPPN